VRSGSESSTSANNDAGVIGRAIADGEPRRVSTVFLLATIVTLVAAAPLAILALDARSEGPVQSTGLLISVGDSTDELSGAVLTVGSDAALSIEGANLVAATWALYDADQGLIASGTSIGAPPFVVDLSPGTIAGLAPGLYDLLVSGTQPDGNVVERAARFAIDDSA
jgi:hypothetical protein